MCETENVPFITSVVFPSRQALQGPRVLLSKHQRSLDNSDISSHTMFFHTSDMHVAQIEGVYILTVLDPLRQYRMCWQTGWFGMICTF